MKGRLELFPSGARVDEEGQLWLGGCRASSLAKEFGTPLYIFDELAIREQCRDYRRLLAQYYPAQCQVVYACKAYLSLALAELFAQEGLGLDVVSGGELYVAQRAGFPTQRIQFHGNNKTSPELATALDSAVGRIVVDNPHELQTLEQLCAERKTKTIIWLRLSPGVDVHTHPYSKTGILDSKFGFSLQSDHAEGALVRAMNSPWLELVGLHAHIGSQVMDVAPYVTTVDILLAFAAEMRARHGFDLRELSPGGGWGVSCHEGAGPAPKKGYIRAVAQAVVQGCGREGFEQLPRLVIEPGRSIIAEAGVALYRVGSRKEIPGVRTYVSVDGGMGDNIRPVLYGARYTALAANSVDLPATEKVTVTGRFCESGDVLIRDIMLPHLVAGDLLAIPRAGAYCLPMASNYNLVPRPAVVLVKEGRAQLMQRRETYGDLVARDLPLVGI